MNGSPHAAETAQPEEDKRMMSDMSTAKLAKAINQAMKQSEDSVDEVLADIVDTYGLDTADAALDEAQRLAQIEYREQEAEHRAWKRQFNDAMAIHAGLPSNTTFKEACRIKAARGDALARRYLDSFNSRQCRLEDAMHEAAVERHPGWRAEGGGVLTKLDDKAPEWAELIEWFYKNFPDEARAVEAAIAKEAMR
jgi:hypothetical protein